MSTNVSKAYHIQVEENSNRSDLSYLSATSLVFSSMLFLPPKVLLTTSSHILYVVGHVESIKSFMSTTITTAYHILVEEISS